MIRRLGASIPVEDLAMGARFLWELPRFLRRPVSLEEARVILCRRFERRESDFLALAKLAIYGQAASPYRQLLDLAGCEHGDLERLVALEGVEGALRILYRAGVYLTVDEFKGRRPAVRGSATIALDPNQLRNPRSAPHVPNRSGGSRGVASTAPVDLANIRDAAVDKRLYLDARGGFGWQHAQWRVHGSFVIVQLLQFSGCGAGSVRWFSQVDPAAPQLHPRYRWSARALWWGSLLAGAPLPEPVHVPLERPLPIAHWLADELRAGRTPHLLTFASSAVRLCQAAFEAGIDLRGAQFTLGSEPITAARLAVIRRTGADALPGYGTLECGRVAYGCLEPAAPDDLHLLHDLHALIQPDPAAEPTGLPRSALLVSSIRPTARFILLNVSLGDQAVMAQRACGCPLERLGWTTHLESIRSFEKLTARGMTFLDADIVRVLEVGLPARFGGGPTDYQLLEEEADDGQPCLRLVVHPAVGPLDEQTLADAFLAAVGAGAGVERVMALQWGQAGLVRVERRVPVPTPAGKVLHLHLERHAVGKQGSRPPI